MKRNKFKPSILHPIKRHRYNKRAKAMGEAWNNMALAIGKLGETFTKTLTPILKAAENLDNAKLETQFLKPITFNEEVNPEEFQKLKDA